MVTFDQGQLATNEPHFSREAPPVETNERLDLDLRFFATCRSRFQEHFIFDVIDFSFDM